MRGGRYLKLMTTEFSSKMETRNRSRRPTLLKGWNPSYGPSGLVGRSLGSRNVYQRIRQNFYWPALEVDCYATVGKCPQCADNRLKIQKNATRLQQIPAEEPPSSVCIDFLGPFIRTSPRNENLLFITYRFSKMKKKIPMNLISVSEVAKQFVNSLVFN